MAAVEVVVFDLGNTLIRLDWLRGARALFPNRPDARFDNLEAMERLAPLVEYETGLVATDAFLDALARGTGFPGPRAKLEEAFCDIFVRWPEREAVLDMVEGRYRLAMLSNTSEAHIRSVERRFPFMARIPVKAYSFELRLRKPGREIYLETARMAGTAPEACLLIDDREDNCEGARAAGMRALRVEPHEDLAAALRGLGLF